MSFVSFCACCKRERSIKLQMCSRCLVALYCDAACQKAHWATHKRDCFRVASSTRDARENSHTLMKSFMMDGRIKRNVRCRDSSVVEMVSGDRLLLEYAHPSMRFLLPAHEFIDAIQARHETVFIAFTAAKLRDDLTDFCRERIPPRDALIASVTRGAKSISLWQKSMAAGSKIAVAYWNIFCTDCMALIMQDWVAGKSVFVLDRNDFITRGDDFAVGTANNVFVFTLPAHADFVPSAHTAYDRVQIADTIRKLTGRN